MKNLRKLIVSVILCLPFLFIAACGNNETADTYKVYAPDGATSLAFSKLINEQASVGDKKLDFTIVSPSNIGTELINGVPDVAIVPTNVAAKVYTAKKNYFMLGVVTHGNLYIVSKDGGTPSLDALKGKVTGVIGSAATPDLIIRYLLKENNIEYVVNDKPVENKVAIKYYNDGAELIPALKQGIVNYGLMGEPAATMATTKIEGAKIYLDVQAEYNKLAGTDKGFPQSVLVVKNEFKDDLDLMTKVCESINLSAEWAALNPELARDAINSAMKDGGTTTLNNLSKGAIERCNINFVKTAEIKNFVKSYLTEMAKLDNELEITTPIPDDGFYLER